MESSNDQGGRTLPSDILISRVFTQQQVLSMIKSRTLARVHFVGTNKIEPQFPYPEEWIGRKEMAMAEVGTLVLFFSFSSWEKAEVIMLSRGEPRPRPQT